MVDGCVMSNKMKDELIKDRSPGKSGVSCVKYNFSYNEGHVGVNKKCLERNLPCAHSTSAKNGLS